MSGWILVWGGAVRGLRRLVHRICLSICFSTYPFLFLFLWLVFYWQAPAPCSNLFERPSCISSPNRFGNEKNTNDGNHPSLHYLLLTSDVYTISQTYRPLDPYHSGLWTFLLISALLFFSFLISSVPRKNVPSRGNLSISRGLIKFFFQTSYLSHFWDRAWWSCTTKKLTHLPTCPCIYRRFSSQALIARRFAQLPNVALWHDCCAVGSW